MSGTAASRFWRIFITATLLLVSIGYPFRLEAADGLKISHKARSLQPGEVILLMVESPRKLGGVEARAFGREFKFYPVDEGFSWQGLVGVDLDVEAGAHSIIVVPDPSSRVGRISYSVEIAPKQFSVRHLKVAPKYVSPPEAELRRIQEESKLVSTIFATVTPTRFWKGSFLRPVPGAASSNFGQRSVFNGQPRSPHTGTDFKASEGTPIKTPGAGRVVLAKDLYFAGNTVIVDHGLGLYSYFAHLSAFDVKEGDAVERGQQVGRVGATGRVTGPHLHWTVRLAQARVSPLSILEVLGP